MAHSHSLSSTDNYYTTSPVDTREFEDSPTHRETVNAPLAQITIPSFSAFRSQASSIPISSPSKRNPLPFRPLRSPRAASFSLAEKASPRLADPTLRPLSLETALPTELFPALSEESEHVVRQSKRYE